MLPAIVSVKDRPEFWNTKRVQITLMLDVDDFSSRSIVADNVLIQILKEKAEEFTLELHKMFGEKVADFCFESKVEEVVNQIQDKTGAPLKMIELNQVYEAEVIED